MSNPTRSDQPRPETPPSADPLEREYAELRTLLLAPEQSQLDHLRDRLDHPVIHAQDVSRVLPDALAIRGQSDPRLTTALTPYFEEGLKTSVRKSPQVIIDAIAPLIGPAIQQAIFRALQGMIRSLNQTLEQGISIRGLRWRLEAWRTGKSFGEIVMLHTLQYRVEQVFLIHRDTGILLHHVAADPRMMQDHVLISGMLTAIREFVTDSFGGTLEQGLDQFQVGEQTVWVEQGPHALLAAVVRGTLPHSLRARFVQALEQIHVDAAESLNTFNGDSTPFSAYHAYLEACFDAEYKTPARHISPITWAMLAFLMGGLVTWGWTSYQRHLRWTNLLDRMRTEPGLVITSEERRGGQYMMTGLRDPLAVDPAGLLADAGFAPEDVRAQWDPYYSLDARFIEIRLRQILKPPSTVALSIDGQTVTVSGTAPEDWAREAKKVASLLPGIGQYRDDALRTQSIPQLVKSLASTRVLFDTGSSKISPSEEAKIAEFKSTLRDLDQMAQQAGKHILINIIGSADEGGPESMKLILGMNRAHAVLAALGGHEPGLATRLKTGVEPPRLIAPARRNPNDPALRHVAFSITVKDVGQDKEQRP
jgi:hypothetical protein